MSLLSTLSLGVLLYVASSPSATPGDEDAEKKAQEREGGESLAAPAQWRELEVLEADARDPEEGFRLFQAGAQAYDERRYRVALDFFRESYRISANPNLLWSLAQVHRSIYELTRDTGALELAVLRLEDYLRLATEGKRRSQAAQAITELRTLAQIEIEGYGEAERPARVLVSSPAPGATVRVGEDAPQQLPTTLELPPGEVVLNVEAEGFESRRETMKLEAGVIYPLELGLEERPAKLLIDGPKGAKLWIDRRHVADLPLRDPLELEAGQHEIAVVKNGKTAYAREVELGRGEIRKLQVEVYTSDQRKASWALVGVGVLGVGLGAEFTRMAYAAQDTAQGLEALRQEGSISADEADRYRDAVRDRDVFRATAAVGLSVGIAALVSSVFTFTIDTPPVDGRTAYPRESQAERERDGAPSRMRNLSLAPWWREAGSDGGLMMRGRF